MSELINFHQAQFMLSAPSLKSCPADTGAEVAFAGRSNAGKSSALNTLTQSRKLARTSKTPGRTQQINYFHFGHADLRLVDLPGYGFARVEKALKKAWDAHLEEYLQQRESLIGLVLLMDIRHPFKEFDQAMLQWAVDADIPVHILLTKADKLKRGAQQKALLEARKSLVEVADSVSIQTFSSLSGDGTEALTAKLSAWYSPHFVPVTDGAIQPEQSRPSPKASTARPAKPKTVKTKTSTAKPSTAKTR
ncbi:ribosome biogenesis GTP-binding protein YihA/YsxC [Salinispirillum marinum]|uniref:Probable GTP-binding protein EngB n=2 Tax=Saccharospirillaceae TaxID=255527 RepID=A0ABV8BET7_9GAMM